MKQVYYSVLFLDRKTRKVLRRFDYPASKIRSKFFWEKIKAQELDKLSRAKMIDKEEIFVQDVTKHDKESVN